MLDTRTHTWNQAGLARELSAKAVRRARIQAAALLPLLAGVIVVYRYREEIFGVDTPVKIAAALALIAIGWEFTRDVGRALGPVVFKRLDPGAAGIVGFLARLLTILVIAILAGWTAGIDSRTLAVGGAATAVVLGLAAQQTLGNLFAGIVLLSARPFRVGDLVELQAGGLAGSVQGIVSSLGLMYTTFSRGSDQIMVPNSVVLGAAVVPLQEPAAVDLRARLRPGVTPADIQALLAATIETPTRGQPRISLEEIDGEEVVVRLVATPEDPAHGATLATEVLRVLIPETRKTERIDHEQMRAA
ncbi:MAG TPA: mechanosensitive ion channel domain-containing protein [Baekduia sp.]|nr:mechanosensitive ion channel domain-containing protein [Baekduia sp.]